MTGWRHTLAAAAAATLLLAGCSDDDAPSADRTPGAGTETSPKVSGGTRHTDAELVEALPTEPDELHGLAAFESCTDFDAPGQCLGQEEGSVLLNLTDGMNQGLLLTVVRDHSPEELTERGALCPDGPIDDPARELGSSGEIPGRQGTGERTDWQYEGWSGWVCRAEYSQVDSDGETQDDYSLRLLLAHNGEHLISLQTASDVDVAQWAEEYVDRLTR